jgi:hypothetical protein
MKSVPDTEAGLKGWGFGSDFESKPIHSMNENGVLHGLNGSLIATLKSESRFARWCWKSPLRRARKKPLSKKRILGASLVAAEFSSK